MSLRVTVTRQMCDGRGSGRLMLTVFSTLEGQKTERKWWEGKKECRERWTEHESKPSNPERGELGVCARIPHLHYLRAAMADDVLLAWIYDRDLDQSAGLPVAAWSHQLVTGWKRRKKVKKDGETEKGSGEKVTEDNSGVGVSDLITVTHRRSQLKHSMCMLEKPTCFHFKLKSWRWRDLMWSSSSTIVH